MKKCKKCNKDKELTNFSKDSRSKDGLQSKCISCNKAYYLENKKSISLKNKTRHLKNKIHNNNRSKEYYKKNSKTVKEYQKKYSEINREKTNGYKNKWRLENKEYYKSYYDINKTEINKKRQERINSDPMFKLKCSLRSLINVSFNTVKPCKTEEIIGCSFEFFKKHIESKFKPFMTWENKGNPKDGVFEPLKNWDIDHIIPLSTAKNESEVLKLNHYTNLQPLCSFENRFIKRDNI